MILMSTKHSRAAGRQGSRNSDQYPGESITGIPFRRAENSRYGIAQTGEDGRSAPGCPVGRGCSGVVSPVVIKSILQSVFFDKNALVASSAQLAVDIFPSVIPLRINTVYMPHRSRQMSGRCLYEEMMMVRHQTTGGYLYIKHRRCFLPKSDKQLIIFSISEDIFSSPVSVHYMIPGFPLYHVV